MWEVSNSPPVGTLVIVILLILAIVGIYALFVYLAIKPSLRKLKSLPVKISVTVIVTAAITSGIIHYIRFVPSPEAASPLSVIIATMFLIAGISGYLLALWVIWSIRKVRES